MHWPPAWPADPGRAPIHRPQADRTLPAWLLVAMGATRQPDLAVALPEPWSEPGPDTGTERAWSCQADDVWPPRADQGP